MRKNIFPFKISDNQSYSTAKIQQHKSNRAKTYRQSDSLLLESQFTFGRDVVFHCLDFVSHITLNCPLFRLDHPLPQLLPLCGEPVFLRGRARRIWLRHLDKAEFD